MSNRDRGKGQTEAGQTEKKALHSRSISATALTSMSFWTFSSLSDAMTLSMTDLVRSACSRSFTCCS